MSTEVSNSETSLEVRTTDDLEAYFHAGAKPRAAWKVGVEYETPAVDASSGEALPYDDAHPAIRELLEKLASNEKWRPVFEDGRIIALRASDGASITLEPGGQVEMSGKQCESIHEAHDELTDHLLGLTRAGDAFGIDFLGLGITPITPLSRASWMPKRRYRIMRAIMETTGRLGHRMMAQTATVQGNFDYDSEADARRKLRVSLALSPVLVALSANSAVCDGQPSGYKSYRAHIWTDTDPRRCGMLPFAFDTDTIFRAYADYALDVPMYFVARGEQLLPVEGMTFRSFMNRGFQGHRATLADWSTHLTTLFPEARLKTYIEVRAADGQPQDRILAIPALLKGLLYEGDCLDAAWEMLSKLSVIDRREAQDAAAKDGLDGRIGRHSLLAIAREVAAIGAEGLRRQANLDREGRDESVYLEVLQHDLDRGLTPADHALAAWRKGGAPELMRLARYRSP